MLSLLSSSFCGLVSLSYSLRIHMPNIGKNRKEGWLGTLVFGLSLRSCPKWFLQLRNCSLQLEALWPTVPFHSPSHLIFQVPPNSQDAMTPDLQLSLLIGCSEVLHPSRVPSPSQVNFVHLQTFCLPHTCWCLPLVSGWWGNYTVFFRAHVFFIQWSGWPEVTYPAQHKPFSEWSGSLIKLSQLAVRALQLLCKTLNLLTYIWSIKLKEKDITSNWGQLLY